MSGKDKKAPQLTIEDIDRDIERLKAEVKQLSAEQKYAEAGAAYEDLQAKQKARKQLQMKQLTDQQNNDASSLNEAYEYLQRQFNLIWNEEMAQFDIDSQKQVRDMEVCIYFDAFHFFKYTITAMHYHFLFLDETH